MTKNKKSKQQQQQSHQQKEASKELKKIEQEVGTMAISGTSRRRTSRRTRSPRQKAAAFPAGVMDTSTYLGQSWKNFPASTPAGRAWGAAVMHPPSAPLQEYGGLPDPSSAPRGTLRLETAAPVSWDTSMFSTAPTDPTTWSLQIVAPDIPEIAFLYRIRNDADGTWSKTRIIRHALINRLDDSPDAVGTNYYRGLGYAGVAQYRIAASSMTADFTGPALANQGESYSGQIVPHHKSYSVAAVAAAASATTPINLYGGANSEIQDYVIPNTPQALIQRDPGSRAGRAAEGSFLPLKFDTSMIGYDFRDAEAGLMTTADNLAGGTTGYLTADALLKIAYLDNVTSDEPSSALFETNSALTVPSGKHYVFTFDGGANRLAGAFSEHSGMQWGVSFFTGMTIGSGATGGASFMVTRYTYLDLMYSGDVLAAATAKLPPLYDPLAIQSIVRLHQCLPSAYPSCANGFFDWIKGLLGFANNNRGVVKDLVGMLPIPGAGTIASAVDTVLPAINSVVNG